MRALNSPKLASRPGTHVIRSEFTKTRLPVFWLVTLVAAMGIYLSTMAPGPLWGDSGDAQLRVLLRRWWDVRELARAHAPYYLSAMALAATGLVSAAQSANMVAAIAGAVTVANMGVLIGLLTRSWVARISGTLLLLLSHTLWQMSCGAEVVTFSTMCLSAELICVVALLQTHRPRLLILTALVHGVGWSTHNLALLTIPAYVVLLVTQRDLLRKLRLRHGLAALGAWLLGCAPLIYLAIDSYRAHNDLGATLRSLFVGNFGPEVANLHLSIGMLARVVAYAVLNFPTPLLLLAIWGWWCLRRVATPGVWAFLTFAGLTHLAFAVRYDVPDQYTFMVHSYLFLCVFIALGIAEFLVGRVRRRQRATTAHQPDACTPRAVGTNAVVDADSSPRAHAQWAICIVLLSVVSPILYAVLPAVARKIPSLADRLSAQSIPYRDAAKWFLQPWRVGDNGAEIYAREVLSSLPADASFITTRTALRPIEYLQQSEHLRPDLLLGEHARANVTNDGQIDADAVRALVATGKFYVASTNTKKLPTWLRNERFQFVAEGLVYRVALRSPDTVTLERPNAESQHSPTEQGDPKLKHHADPSVGKSNQSE
jgi:hypothetical protein